QCFYLQKAICNEIAGEREKYPHWERPVLSQLRLIGAQSIRSSPQPALSIVAPRQEQSLAGGKPLSNSGNLAFGCATERGQFFRDLLGCAPAPRHSRLALRAEA